jgi:predicted metalloprotease
MSTQSRFFEVLATLALVTLPVSHVANISDHAWKTRIIERAQDATQLQTSGTGPTQTMLTDIVTWLSANTDLPATYDHPRVEFVTPAKMHAVRFGGRSGSGPASTAEVGHMAPWNLDHEVEALYDDTSHTIYLHHGWTGTTPAEMSVLVHEMVHHLQNVAGLNYECAQAREKLAYVAQDKWLAQFGRNLGKEARLDAMTMLVRTKCMH